MAVKVDIPLLSKEVFSIMKKLIFYCGLGAIGLSVIGWILSNAESWISVFNFMIEEAGFQIPYALLIGIWAMFLLYLLFMLIFFRKSKNKKNQNKNSSVEPNLQSNRPHRFYDQLKDDPNQK